MQMINIEERAAKCNLCAGELLIVENELYGNRCVFCYAKFWTLITRVKNISLLRFLVLCYYDFKLYQLAIKLIQKKDTEEARMLFLGCISEIGLINIAGVRTIKQKRALCKVMRRYL